MDDGTLVLVGLLRFIIPYSLAALFLGLMAKRKNRNPWAWGLIGGLFCLPTLIVMAFMSYLCPSCQQPLTNDQWKQRTCPRCGGIAAGAPTSPPPLTPPTQPT